MLLDVEFIKVPKDFQQVGKELAAIMIDVGFAKSKTEARNHIKGGAIKINDQKVIDPFARLMKTEDGRILLVEQET
jgi:ribosomal protein S4